jgi:hypothetical protein
MNCEQRMDEMQRFLDQDLTQVEEESLMAHIEQCPDCATSFEQLQRLSAELSLLPMVSPPFGIVDSILPRLAELDAQQAAVHVAYLPTASLRKKPFISWVIGAGFVAAAVVFSLIAVNMSPTTTKDASPMMNKQSERIIASGSVGIADPGRGIEGEHVKAAAKEAPMVASKEQDSNVIKQDKKVTMMDQSATKNTVPSSAVPTATLAPTIVGNNKMAITFSKDVTNNSLASDDGNYIGVIERQVVLIQTPDGNRSYTSSVQWKTTDKISLLNWQANQRLTYEVKAEDGKVKRFIIDVILKSEQEQKS